MKNDEWLTPPEILNALGKFDLDPCAPVKAPWPTAALHYNKEDDGLSRRWAGRVWLNPPFGREAVKWLRKLVEHGDGIALVPARTETAMFYECVWPAADAVCFIKGRPHFHYVDGTRAAANSGAPICLVAYGRRNADALRAANLGVVLGCNASHEENSTDCLWPACGCPGMSKEWCAKAAEPAASRALDSGPSTVNGEATPARGAAE